jgi:hypothetical protein
MTTTLQLREIDLNGITLDEGGHQPNDGAYCVMELAAYLAHEPWSDHPACVSPAIAAFLRSWNDTVDNDFRQKLKPYALRVIGTATNAGDEQTRAWMATDWLVRTMTPAWLDLAGLTAQAAELRALQPLTSDEIAIGVQDLLERVQRDADAAWSAARSAARSAAWSAAWSAARSAAESAAWSAARSAAWSAAWSAARSAAESAARSAAESAAWSAARSAAWSAAWSAAESAAESAAWSAARSAAWSAAESAAWSAAESAARSAAVERFAPTVTTLQASAFELLDRMIEVGKTELVAP